MKPIYLDYNATTPLHPEVAAAMQPFLGELFGNPSSSHQYGFQTKLAVSEAREQLAMLLNCSPDEIIFTSGGSESNNYAIKGIAYRLKNKGRHIITSSVEHPAVSEVCKFLESEGFEITILPVDKYGMVNVEDVKKSLRRDTILISIMHANNEVGTIQPISEIAAIARKNGVIIHCDAAQSVGKIKVDVKELSVDLLSVAAHKFYGPKGIGALYVRNGIQLQKLIHGADHERNHRAGTENIIEIAGIGKAAEIARMNQEKNYYHYQSLRDLLQKEIIKNLNLDSLSEQELYNESAIIRINGHPEKRLPNTLSISFRRVEANTILSEIGDKVAASAGAACHTDEVDVSATLEAMKVPIDYAMGTLRFSTGNLLTEKEVVEAAKTISETILKLQKGTPEIDLTELTTSVKLTSFTHGLGCACKLRPQALEKILQKLPVPVNEHILVGSNTADDAAVFRINNEQAIVQTVDFFTPIVDDPFDFGRIAAANSLSDVYAMGAKPLFALNIAGFPSNRLPLEVLEQILQGAQSIAEEAGIFIVGGHTIDDTEPKYGMAVTGIVHPDKVWKNSGAKSGDKLILTKPIGTGVLTTGLKRGMLDNEQQKILINTMAELNKTSAEVAQKFKVNACTDITGFGLIGHAHEMAAASSVNINIDHQEIEILSGAKKMISLNIIPGGTENNQKHFNKWVDWSVNISNSAKILLNDAQTSGGLLISVAEVHADKLLNELHANGINAATIIGEVAGKGDGTIRIV